MSDPDQQSQAQPPQAVRKITVDDVIDYVWMDKTPGGSNLGRAEFLFCPVWKRGIMRSLRIDRLQQREKERQYELDLSAGKIRAFNFDSWTFKGIEHPWCWRMGWCKEHKGVMYEVYVPPHTGRLIFRPHFGDSIEIHFGDAKEKP